MSTAISDRLYLVAFDIHWLGYLILQIDGGGQSKGDRYNFAEERFENGPCICLYGLSRQQYVRLR